jgi:hypothetical protein
MTKRLLFAASFVILALSLLFSPAFAAYSWVDDNGEFHITDYPKPIKREEPKKSAPAPAAPAEVPVPPATLEVTRATATVPTSTGTTTVKPLVPATAGLPSSAGTLTMSPASPVSQLTATQGGHDALATGATVSQLTTTVPQPAMQEQPRAALPVPQEREQAPAVGIMAFIMAFFMMFLVLIAGIYIYFSLCLFLIAKKLNVSAPWTAWIPIINIWTLLQAAGKPCWWVLLLFIPFVSIIVIAYVWMCIVENLGRNKWLGLLLLVPIVNLVYMGVLAFSKQEQQSGPPDEADMIGQAWKPTPDSSEEQ